jgi:hypothetical protein
MDAPRLYHKAGIQLPTLSSRSDGDLVRYSLLSPSKHHVGMVMIFLAALFAAGTDGSHSQIDS